MNGELLEYDEKSEEISLDEIETYVEDLHY